ncbi:unnamed protein product [Ectocarpus sp. CCAP 1310/34]|nr:unnamed protein product [Ectocarpus sp. CCAP 1310/34]
MQAFGLEVATSLSDVTTSSTSSSTRSTSSASDSDEVVATILSAAYGGDISARDAVTGALAEPMLTSSGGGFGELVHTAWLEQLYRTFRGDRFHHLHSRSIEDASLATISELFNRTTGAADLPPSAFGAARVEVCGADCKVVGEVDVELPDSYKMAWEASVRGPDYVWRADFVICERISTDEAKCIDRQLTGRRSLPPCDDEDAVLEVPSVEVESEWTTVTLLKPTAALDDQDYDLAQDIENEEKTEAIYSSGESLGQHPTSSRGANTINFATGNVEVECDENNFVSLHGALMLTSWMILAPWGIYYVRPGLILHRANHVAAAVAVVVGVIFEKQDDHGSDITCFENDPPISLISTVVAWVSCNCMFHLYRNGEKIDFIWRYEWWEMHEEIMIVASEAVLQVCAPVPSDRNEHTVLLSCRSECRQHHRVEMCVLINFYPRSANGKSRTLLRSEPKSTEPWRLGRWRTTLASHHGLHKFNKFFHIYAGRFAYLTGVIQGYRGLELVASDDKPVFYCSGRPRPTGDA